MPDIQHKVLNWIATGRVGASSRAMALTACEIEARNDYPLDPDDLNRCLLMLDAIPEVRDHFDRIAALGPVWARLIERWAEIEKSFIDEAGFDCCSSRDAPKTYRLMKEVIGEEPGVIQLGAVRFRTR